MLTSLPVIPRLCFNWLPRYRYCLLAYKALQEACASRLCRGPEGVAFGISTGSASHVAPRLARPVLMDAVLKTDGRPGYVVSQFEDMLLPFCGGDCFYPLTEDLALIAAPEEGSGDLLNNVLPYMSPARQTLTALLALAGNYAGTSPAEIQEARRCRIAAAEQLRLDLAARWGLPDTRKILLHVAGVGGLIEATTRYMYRTKPGFTTCVLTPEYWDLLRYILTYSPQGLRLVPGRDRPEFPSQAWLSTLSRSDNHFAYLSFTSNPLGTTVPWDCLMAALEAVPDDTLFFIDCTSFDTEQRSGIDRLSPLIEQFSRKNLLIAKSFSKEYDLGDHRIGYAIFTKPETAEAMWPFMACYPPVDVSQAAISCLRDGNAEVMASYRRANAMLAGLAEQFPNVRVTGACSNYTCVMFPTEGAAVKVEGALQERYGPLMYPGEVPMRGGGDLGLDRGEVDLTTMKRIPFLASNALRLLVTEESVEHFFALLRQEA